MSELRERLTVSSETAQFWPIGYINHDGGITFEPGREPGEHAPGKLVYIIKERK